MLTTLHWSEGRAFTRHEVRSIFLRINICVFSLQKKVAIFRGVQAMTYDGETRKDFSSLTASEIEGRVHDLNEEQAWNHNIELPYGINTKPSEQTSHGKNLIKLERIRPILEAFDLRGKKVLDIGCNEGFFAQHIAKEAKYVLGGDIDELRIKKAKFVNSVLATQNVDFRVLDIYSNEFAGLERFDLCICMGFLHRVPDPFRAISALCDRTNTILFEWKVLKHGDHHEPIAFFSQKDIDHNDYYGTEYWLISYAAVESMLQRCGFKHFHRVDDPRQRRAILLASRDSEVLSGFEDEIMSYPRLITVVRHTRAYLRTLSRIISGKINA